MAELKFKNERLRIYATPKCGINSVVRMTRQHRALLNTLPRPVGDCIVVRNPWIRTVSFYVDKIVQHRAVHTREQLCQRDFRETKAQKLLREAGKHEDISEMTFLELLRILAELDDRSVERHLKSQTYGVEDVEFVQVLRLEHIDAEVRTIHPGLTIPRLNDSSRARGEYGNGRAFDNPHHRRPVERSGAFEMRPADLRASGIPVDYRYFFNDEAEALIKERYATDIERFDYTFPFAPTR